MNEKIDNLLKQKTPFSLKELKLQLKVLHNKDLFIFLGLYLEEKLDTFDYKAPNKKYTHLYKIFPYFMYIIEHINSKNEEVYSSFLKLLKKKVSLLIEGKSKNIKNFKNEELLKKIKNNIEVCEIQLTYYAEKDKPDAYDFMKYLLFKIRQYHYIWETVQNNPQVVNYTRQDDFSLFELLMLKCLEAMETENHQDVVYYEKVINLFLCTPQFAIPYHLKLKEKNSVLRMQTDKNQEYLSIIQNILRQWEMKTIEKEHSTIEKKELFKLYNIRDTFDGGIFASLPDGFPKQPYVYEDLTDKKIFSLDMDGTDIFDDALSFEVTEDGYELGVYTADVSGIVSLENPVFMEAYHRAKNIYLFDKTMYTFPRNLSKNVLSLNQGQEKWVQAYLISLDKNLKVTDFTVKKAKIKVRKNYFYSELEQKLFHEKNPYGETIEQLSAFATICKQKDQGKNTYHTVKEQMRFLEANQLSKQNPMRRYRSYRNQKYNMIGQQIITEIKILLNTLLAQTARQNHYSFIYRACTMHTDKQKLMDMLEDFKPQEENSFPYHTNPTLIHSYYTVHEEPHAGLEKDIYCHALTPIINIISYLNQALFYNQYVEGQRLTESEKQALEKASIHLNNRVELNEAFVKQYTKMYQK